MSGSEDPEVGKDCVVVVTTYPTTYGANEGVERTEAEFLRGSDIDVYGPDTKNGDPSEPGSGFQNYDAAVAFAREMLDKESVFTDHHYTEDDEPPFDSADFENYDNDEEVCIAIMSKAGFAQLLKYNLQTMGLIDARGEPPNCLTR
jgi:hypothetical protein